MQSAQMNHKFFIGRTCFSIDSHGVSDQNIDEMYDKMSFEDKHILLAKAIDAVSRDPEKYIPMLQKFIDKAINNE